MKTLWVLQLAVSVFTRNRGVEGCFIQPSVSFSFPTGGFPFFSALGQLDDCCYTFCHLHLLFYPYSQGRGEIFPQHAWPQGPLCSTEMACSCQSLPPDSTHRVEAPVGCHVYSCFHSQRHHADSLKWGQQTSMPIHSWFWILGWEAWIWSYSRGSWNNRVIAKAPKNVNANYKRSVADQWKETTLNTRYKLTPGTVKRTKYNMQHN